MTSRLRLWAAWAGVLAGVACTATPFGKSIVRNEDFQWRVIAGEHFDLYYYEGESFLAEYALESAEESFAIASEAMGGVELKNRIPVIVFGSTRQFEQNNILTITGEGVGGFSEPLKRRLVMPYDGSQRQFEETMTHEMAHILTYELIYPTFGSVFQGLSPPDWFMEGIAEHVADDWNPEGEMVLRDFVMTGYALSLKDLRDFNYLPNAFLGYKLGQSILDYIAEEYGEDALTELLEGYEKTTLRSSEHALEDALGVKEDDLSEDWQVWLKKRYWPLIGAKAQLKDFATQVTPKDDRRKYISYFKPAFSPSGELMACLTVKDRFLDIFLVNSKTGEKFDNLTKGYTLNKYEYIQYLQNGLSWSPDGNFIAFVGKKDTFDQIYILNVFNHKVVRRYNPRFEDILAPAYSPDGRKIAFAGIRDNKRDIWVMDVATGELTAVTDDYYSDGYPTWSPDGRYIYYASERQTFHNIFRIRPDGTDMEQLTFGPNEDISPAVSPDGKRLLFVSDRIDGIFNLFVMDLETRTTGQYTDVVTGVMDGAWSPDGQTIAFTSFENMTYAVWRMPWQDEPLTPATLEAPEPGEYGYEEWNARRGGAPASPPATLPAEAAAPFALPPSEGPPAPAAIVEGEEEAGGESPAGAVSEEKSPAVTAESGTPAEEEPSAEPPSGLATVRALPLTGGAVEGSRRYTPKWGPDYVYTTFSYTTGGILENYSVLGFSDILAAHRLDVLFDLTSVSSFNDVNAAVDYYYLPKRTAYVLSAMTWRSYYIAGNTPLYERLSGGSAVASYPFNMRNRVDFGPYGYARTRWYYYGEGDPVIPDRHENTVGVAASLIHDTSQWEVPYHPTAGSRVDLTVRQTAPVSNSSQFFTETVLDARRYIRLTRRMSFAFRGMAGKDFGRDPGSFFIGGGSTVRGYGYSDIYGSEFAMGNFEFRFPIVDYVVWPIEGFVLGDFRGLVFADFGTAWGAWDPTSVYPEDHQWYTERTDLKYDRYTFATDENGWHLVHGKASFGVGLRWWFGYFDLKLDWAWRTNLHGVENPPVLTFSIGPDF